DFEKRVWRIPADRMKMKEPHEVPLSIRALELLEEAKAIDAGPLLFPGAKEGKPLSGYTMLSVVQRMNGYEEITVHGTGRGGFKTWATERTKYRDQVIESCLAHRFKNLDPHYLRTDFPRDRRRLLDEWARFLTQKPTARVVKMSR